MALDNDIPAEQGRATPYRAVWRWHFYAGLMAAPFLVILAITGSLYLFEQELDAAWHGNALQVEIGDHTTTLAHQEAVIQTAYPGAVIRSVVLPRAAEQAARWTLQRTDGSAREVFVNPYTARISGDTNPALNPLAIARDLHGNLLTGEIGSHVVELVACGTLVMLVTGLYLWWPRQWRKAAFVPRAAAKGRAFWRDWHSIPAMFNSLLVMFLIFTGLPWSAFWGTQFAKLGQHSPFIAPSPNFTAHLPASITGLPWPVQHHGAPQGSYTPRVSVDVVESALTRLDIAGYGPGVKISWPMAPGGVFLVSYIPSEAQGQRTLYVDPGDGSVLGDIGWRDYSPTAKAIEWGVMTHMGRQYGLANQLAGLTVCMVIVGSVIAGVVMWWRRRPPGRLAAPQLREGDRLPRFLVITLTVMGLVFPLLGAALIVAWLIDRYAASDSGRGRPTA